MTVKYDINHDRWNRIKRPGLYLNFTISILMSKQCTVYKKIIHTGQFSFNLSMILESCGVKTKIQ